jgi:hypothetical protein
MSPYGPPNPFPRPTSPGLQAIQQTMQEQADVRMLLQQQQFYDAQAAARQKNLKHLQHHRAEVKAFHVILGLSRWAVRNQDDILLFAESARAYWNSRSQTGEEQPDTSQSGRSPHPSPKPQSAKESDPRVGDVPPSSGSPTRPAADPRLAAGERRPRIIFNPDGTYGSAP